LDSLLTKNKLEVLDLETSMAKDHLRTEQESRRLEADLVARQARIEKVI
jgi:hypothetical protein